MFFTVQIESTEDGEYQASCADPLVSSRGLTPAIALDRLGAEIRYRLEFCPCSSVDDDYIQLRIEG